MTELPAPPLGISDLAPGPDGNVWYLGETEVGFISRDGKQTDFGLQRAFAEGGIVAGSDGNMWATERNDSGSDAILRIAANGQVSRFRLPQRESGPRAITLGPDDALWFTESFGRRIGRITMAGKITEYPVAAPPEGIAAGPDGNLWFTQAGGVGRITTTGKVTEFPSREPRQSWKGVVGPIASGPDGRLWFPDGVGRIGRISPSGRISQVALPARGSYPGDIALGPDGALWYTALGEHPCEGGGVTCQMFVPSQAGRIGRVAPGPLTISLAAGRATSVRGRTKLHLRCQEGDATGVCRGTLRLTAQVRSRSRKLTIGRSGYRLHTDTERAVELRLTREARTLLQQRGHLVATAKVTLRGGKSDRRSVRLLRS
ncbi:MAG: hypothetical protein ACJ76D_00595 [Solirubrobacterales bacterium]